MRSFDNEDRKLLIQLYDLTDEELKQAEKMYHKSSRSVCACGKLIKQKRTGTNP